jgi:hypothetical protein
MSFSLNELLKKVKTLRADTLVETSFFTLCAVVIALSAVYLILR